MIPQVDDQVSQPLPLDLLERAVTLHRLQTEHLLVDVLHQPPPVARVDGALDQSEVSKD